MFSPSWDLFAQLACQILVCPLFIAPSKSFIRCNQLGRFPVQKCINLLNFGTMIREFKLCTKISNLTNDEMIFVASKLSISSQFVHCVFLPIHKTTSHPTAYHSL